MNNNEGSAIRCSECAFRNKDGYLNYAVLGSITSDGVLIVKRAHNLITKIRFTQPFVIYCVCGFETIVNPTLEVSDYAKQN